MNSVVHFEMPYEDPVRLVKFYMHAFGWRMHKLGEDMGDYVTSATTETDENNMIRKPGAVLLLIQHPFELFEHICVIDGISQQ